MDCIFNHSDSDAPLTQIDHGYWYSRKPSDPNNSWGPEFDYDRYDENLDIKPAWQFIGDVVRFWIEEYHIDGIRYDASKQIDNYEFFTWITQQARQAASIKKKRLFHSTAILLGIAILSYYFDSISALAAIDPASPGAIKNFVTSEQQSLEKKLNLTPGGDQLNNNDM